MDSFDEFTQAIMDPVNMMMNKIVGFIPKLLSVLVILLAGLFCCDFYTAYCGALS